MQLPTVLFHLQNETQPVTVTIKIEIPQKTHQQPVISELISVYNLKVNIIAALLCRDGVGGGWFDLELEGTPEQIKQGIVFLMDNGTVVWKTLIGKQRQWLT